MSAVWSGAGIPVLGSVTVSGCTGIVIKAGSHLVEYAVPGLERQSVDYLGRDRIRVEIHGMDFRSGAMDRLALISGYIGMWQPLTIPSTESGFYFFGKSGVQVLLQELAYQPTPGYGYPFYKWQIKGVLSGSLF